MKSFTTHSRSVLHFAAVLLVLFVQLNLSPNQVARAQGFSLPAQINKSFDPISISAGGISTLSVTIYNPNSFDLILSNSNAWTDDLSSANANLNFANPIHTTTTCGGIVSAVGTTLSLNGGTVPAQVLNTPGSCTVTVDVTSTIAGNHINNIPASILNATDPTGTIPVTNTTPASATLQVNSVQPPSLSKIFNPNTIWVGDQSLMSITIRNNDANSPLTQVSLTDNLPSPPDVTIVSGFAASQCGGTVTATTTSISLTGGSIGPSGSCTITAHVTSNIPGIYINTIPAGAIHTQQAVTNSSAASAPLNVQSIGIIKSFNPSNFQSGGTSVLTITLQNPSSSNYTGAAFTDTLPAGLTLVPPPTTPQCGGTVTYPTSSTIQLSGGTIPSGSSATPGTCTVVATVTSTTPASYTNNIPAGALHATKGATDVTNILPANANVTVYGTGLGVGGSKSFNPSTIPVGGISTLHINITAPADTSLTNFSLSDALPSGVRVAGTPNPSQNANCGGGLFAPSAGDTHLTFSGGSIPVAATCTLTVDVTSSAPGIYSNVISPANISDNEHRNVPGNFTADLTVSGLSISKEFAPTTVNPEGISTLTITLQNTNTSQLDNVSLSETLPGALPYPIINGVVIAPTPNASTTCTGGSVSATAGSLSISMTGGIIPAQVGAVPGICTIVLDVIGKGIAHTYTNRIRKENVTGRIHNTTTDINPPADAIADLAILPITIGVVKGFNPLTVFAGSASTLTIKLSNPNSVSLNGIKFTDLLPQGTGGGMSVANPPNPNVGTCGGSISAVFGATSFSFSGGSLAPSANCSLSLSVTMNVEANLTNHIGIGDVTSANGAKNTQATDATLTNLPGVSISKVFSPNPILAGDTSTITFTIINTGNVALTGLGFKDKLPAGMTAVTPIATPQCGGTMSWDSTTNTISLTGGAIGISPANCTITVVVNTIGPNSYHNCVPANGITDTQGATNSTAACDTLVVTGAPMPPTISKAFFPNPIVAGGTTALTFTITNPSANTVPLSGVTFTDPFPVGVTRASVPNVSQCGGTVSSTPGSVTLTGGTLAVNGVCTVTVSVTAAAGSYLNTSDTVKSTNGGTGNAATDTLKVFAPPQIAKAFSPGSILAGGTTTLTFTLTNPAANPDALTGVAFSDTYPFDLINVATVLNTCGGTLTATAGANNISLTGGSIPVSSSCAVSVTVKATHAGTLVNTTSAVTSTEGGTGNTATDTLTVTGTGLSLVKSTTTVGYQTAGDAISYSYLLTNTGSPDLYPPYTVSDNKASGVICPSTPDPLPQNGTVTCTATYNVVEPPDITNGSVTNTATGTAHDASGGGGNIVTSNPSSVTVHIESLALKKSTTTTSYKNVGDTINYNYTLTNTGGVTLYAPFDVGDNKIGGGTFSCGAITSLAPGANVTCTATYTVIAGDVSAGSVTNTATGTAYDSGGKIVLSNSSSVTVYTLIPPTISKAFSPTSIKVGETSILTFTITNPAANAVPLTGVTFTDNLPAGLSVASAPSAAQCGGTVNSTATSVTLTAGTIINGIGGLDGLCTVTVIVSGNTSGVKNNTSGAVSSTNSGTGNTANATLTVTGPPTISKSFTPGSILQGGTSTITFTLTNPAGNTVPLTGVGFTDSLPLGVTVATSGPISACGGSQTTTSPSTISFSGGILAIGGTCTLTVNVTAGSAGTFNNTTSAVTSTEGGTGATSNTATLIANATVDLAITKNDGRTLVSHGDVLTYSIVVSNTGPNPATGATVTDVIPATLTGATWTCTPAPPATCTASGSGNINDTVTIPVNGSVTYTLTATVTNVIANDVINIATVSPPAGLADTNLANNSATDIDHLTNNGVKTLTGTEQPGSTGTNVLIGEIIDYQIRIDIPNGTVDNLKAVDVLDHGLAFVGCDLTTPITKGTLVLGKNPCTTFGNPTVQAEPVTDLDPASENAGRHITFDFGNVTNPSGSTQSLYVNYRVIVLNIKDNASGVTGLNNAVEWSWTVTPPSGPPVTYTLTGAATGVDVIEPHLSITKSVNPAIAAPGSTVTFTIEISHASNSTAPAYDALMTDGIPTGLGLNQASIVVTPSAGLTAVPVIKTSATQFSVYWSEFPLGESATIIFTATYNGPSPLVNTANVEWSSIQIDPATHLVPLSTFNRHSTERRYDPLNQSLNDYIAAASATLRFPKGPLTGFAPGQITLLPPQPEDKAYQNLGSLWLEIPHISVKTSIVGIPLGTDGNWDLTWLSDQAGYLDGTAYPTHAGNSVLTGHVYLADGSPGPFINLHTLQYGDQIIVHLDDQNYIYEVRSDQVTSTSDTSAFKHEDYPWLTLITCKDYDAATNTYTHHVVVRAVLIKIDSDTLPNPGGSRH